MKSDSLISKARLSGVTLICVLSLTVPANAHAADPAAKYQKPDEQTMRQKLTAEEYFITQESGTEMPFKNKYWNNHDPGIYVDVVTGEPLFSSIDKYDSGTGWPSFTRPINAESLKQKSDRKLLMERTEVRSAAGDSHLGHVFKDGPGPDGNRFCINSSALRFVPVDQLEQEGYGEYAQLFEKHQPASR